MTINKQAQRTRTNARNKDNDSEQIIRRNSKTPKQQPRTKKKNKINNNEQASTNTK